MVCLFATLQTIAKAKWWYQDPLSDVYQAAANAVETHWGMSPGFVCEGGTMRVSPFLEDVLKAPVVLLPLSQSSANCHLPVRSLVAQCRICFTRRGAAWAG